jgi:MFS superfamily sulfate permease-like transporter
MVPARPLLPPERRPENEQEPGVVVLPVESWLFFANADHIRKTTMARTRGGEIRAVVLDAKNARGGHGRTSRV